MQKSTKRYQKLIAELQEIFWFLPEILQLGEYLYKPGDREKSLKFGSITARLREMTCLSCLFIICRFQ